MKRLLGATLTLLSGSIFIADCTPTTTPLHGPPAHPSETRPGTPLAGRGDENGDGAKEPSAPAPSDVDPPGADSFAHLNAGDLARTRLIAADCDANRQAVRGIVERRVAKMREEVDAAWDDWRKNPECGDAFGAGGLGLSGIGEGGGGRGEGIGLGSIGSIGHGSGFGAGHGRLGGSHSRTNNQVDGVEEADIVKTDGRYLYLAVNGALRIIDARRPRAVSVTPLSGKVRKMLIDGDRAVVFLASGEAESPPCTYGYDCTFSGDGTRTKIIVMNVADRAHPYAMRQLNLSGSLIAARAIGSAVHTVVADHDTDEPDYESSPSDVPYCKKEEAAVHARFERLKRDNERRIRAKAPTFPTLSENGTVRELCDVMHTPLGNGQAFTTLMSFDVRDNVASPVTVTVQSRPGAVFASENALYLAVRHERRDIDRPWNRVDGAHDEISGIHKFRIGGRPGQTHYTGSGVVPGHVLNQFAMDERHGYLRVATTLGRVPQPNVESSVSILAENEASNLARAGAIDHIAPTEDIRAVRFDGDRGYVVTFKKTDPLFVLDLANPTDPKILGELKIPGFSTYMHRIDPTHLLSIGFDADDRGSFAYFNGLILQLFDVTNPTRPELLHKERIGTRGSSSEAATDHLAFNYFAEEKTLAIPLTVCEGGGNGRFGMQESFSGLYLYNVTAEKGFQRLGGVDHGKQGGNCTNWWSHATSAVKRSVFVDDFVFSIAGDRVKVQRMKELGRDVAEIALAP